MKIIMFSEYPYSEADQGMGGIIQATFQLVEGFIGLNDLEQELHIVTKSKSCSTQEVRKLGNVTIHFLPYRETNLEIIIFSPIRFFLYARRLIKTFRPDLIHGQGTVSYLILSLVLGKRSIQTVHGLYRNEQSAIPKDQLTTFMRIKFFLKVVLEKFYLRRILNLIAITSQIPSVMREEGNNKVKVFPINNAIDNSFYDIGELKPQSLRTTGEINILFVAAITPRKGLHVLIESFKRLALRFPNLKLTVVGVWDWAPEYVQEQSTACEDLQSAGRVVFTGGLNREGLIKAFQESDIFVLPSFAESAPMVISQAMCAGLPVVSTNVGGIPEMIEHGVTGVLLEPGNVEALTIELARLVSNPEIRQQMGTAARKVGFKRYHPISIARATTVAYHEVILN